MQNRQKTLCTETKILTTDTELTALLACPPPLTFVSVSFHFESLAHLYITLFYFLISRFLLWSISINFRLLSLPESSFSGQNLTGISIFSATQMPFSGKIFQSSLLDWWFLILPMLWLMLLLGVLCTNLYLINDECLFCCGVWLFYFWFPVSLGFLSHA